MRCVQSSLRVVESPSRWCFDDAAAAHGGVRRAALSSCVQAVSVGFHSFRFSSVSFFHIADSSC